MDKYQRYILAQGSSKDENQNILYLRIVLRMRIRI